MATHPRRPSGFSLVELMIVMVIGSLLIAAIGGVFLSSSRTYQQDQGSSQMRDELRFALASMTNDIEMAGFWGELLDPANITLDTGTLNDPGCSTIPGWAYSDRRPIFGIDGATGATANARFPCIDASEVQAGTDIISIKRVAGAQGAAGSGAFLRTNGTVGTLFTGAVPNPAVPAPFDDWQFRPAIYFIRNYSVTAGDGIPTLCRKILQGAATPTYASECLAEGIEDLQIEYGIDRNGDDSVDQFMSNPTANQFGFVVNVRIYLLGRTHDTIRDYNNEKTYQLGNATARTPGDKFIRRAMSSTVFIRNPTSLRRFLGSRES